MKLSLVWTPSYLRLFRAVPFRSTVLDGKDHRGPFQLNRVFRRAA